MMSSLVGCKSHVSHNDNDRNATNLTRLEKEVETKIESERFQQ